MPKIESRIGVIPHSAENIFDYLVNFDNFRSLLPEDRVQDFESSGDSCRFTVDGIGQAGLKIIEKVPHTLIKIGSDEQTPFELFLWIQLKELAPGDSRMKITTEISLNPVMAAMVKNPLKKLVDTLVEQAEKLDFKTPG